MSGENHNPELFDEAIQEMLKNALDDATSATAGDHIIDDEPLLQMWSLGELTEPDRKRIVTHLAGCHECCEELNSWINDGIFTPGAALVKGIEPQPLIGDEPAVSPLRRDMVSKRGAAANDRPLISTVVACLLLGTLGLIVFRSGATRPSQVIALQKRLQQGEPTSVLRDALIALQQTEDSQARRQLSQIVEDAAKQAGVEALRAGDFDQAKSVAQKAEAITRTAELANLRLQAERGERSFVGAIAQLRLDQLLAVTLDGRSLTKSIGPAAEPKTLTPHQKGVQQAYEDAVREFPDDISLRLNFGHFLLSVEDYSAASDHFAAAGRMDPANTNAAMGQGIVAFSLGDYEKASSFFEQALALNPTLTEAMVNRAISLEAMGKPAEARPHWLKLMEHTRDGSLKEDIRRIQER